MNNKRTIPRRGLRPLDAGGIFLLTQISIYVFQSLIMLVTSLIIQSGAGKDNAVSYMILQYFMMLVNMAVFILTPYIYSRFNGIDFVRELDLKRGINIWQVLMLVLISLLAIVAFAPVASLVGDLFVLMGFKFDSSIPIYFNNFGYFVLTVIFTALLPAIGEEIACRAYLARGLRKEGMIFAIIFSALLFATMHGNPFQLVHQFFLGVVLVIVYFATRSIYASIIVHFTNNFLSLLVSYILVLTTGSMEFEIPLEGAGKVFAMLGIGLVGFVALFFAMWGFLRITKKRQDAYVGDRNVDISTMRVYGKHNKKGTSFIGKFVDYMKYLNYSFEEEKVEHDAMPIEAVQFNNAENDSDRQYYGDLLRARRDKEKRWDLYLLIMPMVFNLAVLIFNMATMPKVG